MSDPSITIHRMQENDDPIELFYEETHLGVINAFVEFIDCMFQIDQKPRDIRKKYHFKTRNGNMYYPYNMHNEPAIEPPRILFPKMFQTYPQLGQL